MSSLRLAKGRKKLQAMSKKVWKNLTNTTKLLCRFITHKSKKLVVIENPISRRKYTTTTTTTYLSPRRTNLKRRKLHKRYKLHTSIHQNPIYIDNLFKTSKNYPIYSSSQQRSSIIPSSLNSSSFRRKIGNCKYVDEDDDNHDDDQNVHHGEGSSIGLMVPSLGVDERAEQFIASFRAELDKSCRKWQ